MLWPDPFPEPNPDPEPFELAQPIARRANRSAPHAAQLRGTSRGLSFSESNHAVKMTVRKKAGREGLGELIQPAVPVAVEVCSVKVEVPFKPLIASDVDENEHVAIAGRFEQLRATEPLKPPEGMTETLNDAACPEAMVAVDG